MIRIKGYQGGVTITDVERGLEYKAFAYPTPRFSGLKAVVFEPLSDVIRQFGGEVVVVYQVYKGERKGVKDTDYVFIQYYTSDDFKLLTQGKSVLVTETDVHDDLYMLWRNV